MSVALTQRHVQVSRYAAGPLRHRSPQSMQSDGLSHGTGRRLWTSATSQLLQPQVASAVASWRCSPPLACPPGATPALNVHIACCRLAELADGSFPHGPNC